MSENAAVSLEELEGLQENYEGASVATNSGAGLPDNDYLTKITDMFVGKSKAGKIQVVTAFEVVDGDLTGSSKRRYDGLEDETNISYFKQMCEVLGIEYPESLKDLPKILSDFVSGFAGLVKMTVKTKGEFTNVYVNGVVENEDMATDPGE